MLSWEWGTWRPLDWSRPETAVTEIRVTIMEGMWLQEVCQCSCVGCVEYREAGDQTRGLGVSWSVGLVENLCCDGAPGEGAMGCAGNQAFCWER